MVRTHAAAAFGMALVVLLLLSPSLREQLARPLARSSPASVERRIEIVEIELPAEPEARPLPPPRPAPSPPPLPATQVPSSDALERGESLLRSGRFPHLRASYGRIGFEAYRDAMLELGGVFFLFDGKARQPVAEVDPRTGALGGELVRADLSRWPRDVTRHLSEPLRLGQASYGPRVSRVILLPPARLDAALLGGLDAHLRALDLDPGDLLRVDLAYELRGGNLYCDVLLVAMRDGTERSLSLQIDLSGGMTRTEVAL
ncbi:MAG: hypothetical protein O7B23_07710 [Deltaproteobacteria bacterium]|nr:hypothetical protein [Myxococcales bacterium]MCZ6570029.1 hypothetical protein [Deltaproteobacteria bacterium]MCZ6713555.1 hypothetical protein [Deltaproteobacteria bacterium]